MTDPCEVDGWDEEVVAEALWRCAGFGDIPGERVFAERPQWARDGYLKMARAAVDVLRGPEPKVEADRQGMAEGEERWTIWRNEREWEDVVEGSAVDGVVVVRASRFEEVQQELADARKRLEEDWKVAANWEATAKDLRADLERAQEALRCLAEAGNFMAKVALADMEGGALAEARERGEDG